MNVTGATSMPLHFGRVPSFLTERIGTLGCAVMESVVQNYGKSELLSRLSDSNYFQCLAAAVGFQWNSSGTTSVVLGSIRPKINARSNELGIHILGGKGKRASYLPTQIERVSDRYGLKGNELVTSSQLTRKVDNNAIIDNYSLYQSHFILSDEGEWVGINQGLNTATRRARRYHTKSDTVPDFCCEPHASIVGIDGQVITNLVDKGAENARTNIVQLTKESPSEVADACRELSFGDYHEVRESDVDLKRLGAALAIAHRNEIDNFEDLLLLKGVGPKTLRSLALVSELIHGSPSRFSDPARFSFALGGKDSNPFPLDKKAYDETIQFVSDSVEKANLNFKDKSRSLKRLHRATRQIEEAREPEANLDALKKAGWKHAEKNGGLTFMGPVIPGITRAIFSMQNALLYGKKKRKSK